MEKYREQRDENNVLEGYVRTADGATIPISPGNTEYQKVSKWLQSNTADPDTSALDLVKQKKVAEYRREGITRISTHIPEWDDMEKIKFIASIWNMLGPPNLKQTKAKNIFTWMEDTLLLNLDNKSIDELLQMDASIDLGWPE
jgi:hypothetical protein